MCLPERIHNNCTCRVDLSAAVFLRPYLGCVFAGPYFMALHMYCLVFCIWGLLRLASGIVVHGAGICCED